MSNNLKRKQAGKVSDPPQLLPSVEEFKSLSRREMFAFLDKVEATLDCLHNQIDIKYGHIEHIKQETRNAGRELRELRAQPTGRPHESSLPGGGEEDVMIGQEWDGKVAAAGAGMEAEEEERARVLQTALTVQASVRHMKNQIQSLADDMQTGRRALTDEQRRKNRRKTGSRGYLDSLPARGLHTITEDMFGESSSIEDGIGRKSCRGRPASPHPKKFTISDVEFNKLMYSYHEKAKALSDIRRRKMLEVPPRVREMEAEAKARVRARQDPPRKSYLQRHRMLKVEHDRHDPEVPRVHHSTEEDQSPMLQSFAGLWRQKLPAITTHNQEDGQACILVDSEALEHERSPVAEFKALSKPVLPGLGETGHSEDNSQNVSRNKVRYLSKSAHTTCNDSSEKQFSVADFRSDDKLIRKDLLDSEGKAFSKKSTKKSVHPHVWKKTTPKKRQKKVKDSIDSQRSKVMTKPGDADVTKLEWDTGSNLDKLVGKKTMPGEGKSVFCSPRRRQKLIASAYK